ncbi:T9SS type A sorting domain-containing protein [uncultured Cytophaga sp.]|uniref:rhamnogalacturonan lyase family protein n=1 Tax=uncultured Cytophaga sp. TaxID=160238 RepID=UPI002607003D|nr:T9SS type A sorting domain-containing protein [uncultured Cytophaga sp.]
MLTFQLAFAQYNMEYLNRGIVAVSTGGSNVFISWRWLGTEDNITFNLYRNGTKINASPLAVCNYTDNAGNSSSSYTVRAIVNGVEQGESEAAKPWAQQYLKIPLNIPAGGKTPDGVSYTYNANDCSVGDIDGDGIQEIFLKWDPSNSKDNSQKGYTGNVYIDCYTMKGSFLWRIDLGKNIRAGAHYTQFLVYDFDGDGKVEMACKTGDGTKDGKGVVIGNGSSDHRNSSGYILSGPEYLTIFNGQTGAAMSTVNYTPARGTVSSWGDSYGNRVDRFIAAVVYLDGVHPSMVFGRGYYTRLVRSAWDFKGGKLVQRWIFDSNNSGSTAYKGQGNHQMTVGDVDGDGKQELCNGASIIDDNGSGLYANGHGHGDALHMSDMDPDRPGLEIWQNNEEPKNYGDNCIELKDAKTGKTIFAPYKGNQGDIGRSMAADIDPRYKGYEMWAQMTTYATFNCKGVKIASSRPSVNFAVYWDGDLQRELLDGSNIDKWDYLNSKSQRIVTLSDAAWGNGVSCNTTKATPNLSGDILGDWREEVILHSADNKNLLIYTTTIPSTYKFRTLLHDPQYRVAIAWQNSCYNQPPHLGYYLGSDMATPAKPNIKIINPGNTTTCSASISSPTNTICGSGSVLLTANAGSSYKWFNGTNEVGTASTYSAKAAGSYTVQVTNAAGCKATSSAKTITLNPLPIITQYVKVNTGAWTEIASITACETSSVNLGPQPNVVAGWSWTGPNNFTSTLRDPILTNILVTNAGNYIATYTDAKGCKATSTFELKVTKPTSTITPPNTTVIPFAGKITLNAVTANGYIYQWNKNNTPISAATESSYSATNPGSYTLTVTTTGTTNCSATSKAVILTAALIPKKYIYTYDNSGNYSWTNANNWSNKVVPSAIDTIIIRSGEVQIDNLNHMAPVYVEANGILRLVSNSSIDNLHLQGGTLKVYTSNPQFDLQANIVVEKPSTIMAGSIAQTVFAINGKITGAANLSKTSVGVLMINSDASAFKGKWVVEEGKLKIRSMTGMGACGVQVKANARLDIETASATSIYSLEIDSTGSVDLDTDLNTEVAVFGSYNIASGSFLNANYPTYIGSTGTLKVTKSIISLSGKTTFCPGSNVTMTATPSSSYSWKNNANQIAATATYTANQTGIYAVDITNSTGCKVSSAPVKTSIATPTEIIQNIKIDNGTWNAVTSASVCTSSTVSLGPWPTNTVGWTWIGPNNFTSTLRNPILNNVSAANAGTYTATYTDPSGCKATSNFTLLVNALPDALITAPSNSICSGKSIILNASAGNSYNWYKGSTPVGTASTLTVIDAGAYTVEVTNNNGCKALSAATQISLNAVTVPTITASSNTICSGKSIILNASAGNSYNWYKGSTPVGTASTLTVTDAGAYTVEVTNNNGCKALSAATQISLNTADKPIITAPNTSFCEGNSVILSASNGEFYKWYNSGSLVGENKTLNAISSGNYVVEVTNASGCKTTSDPIIITTTEPTIWYADTDGDGFGDPKTKQTLCWKPTGYIEIAGDACPTDPNKTTPGNCGCGKIETSCFDCAGIANGSATLDNCNICTGGTTGFTACVTTATINGTHANITVIPQPFDITTKISIHNVGIIQSYTIISANGALIETRSELNTEEITLGEELASGLYTVIIRTEKGMYTTKIVKK